MGSVSGYPVILSTVDFTDEPMTRPLRIEFPASLYHITSHDNARADISIQNFTTDLMKKGLRQRTPEINQFRFLLTGKNPELKTTNDVLRWVAANNQV